MDYFSNVVASNEGLIKSWFSKLLFTFSTYNLLEFCLALWEHLRVGWIWSPRAVIKGSCCLQAHR